MKTNTLLAVTTAIMLLATACEKPQTPSLVAQVPQPPLEDSTGTNGTEYAFIPINEWLPGSVWVSKFYFSGIPMSGTGLAANRNWFHETYTHIVDNIGPTCADTINFESTNTDLHHLPYPGRALTYSILADSSVSVGGSMARIYQISADSLVMWYWPHLCSYTLEIQSALYVKIQ